MIDLLPVAAAAWVPRLFYFPALLPLRHAAAADRFEENKGLRVVFLCVRENGLFLLAPPHKHHVCCFSSRAPTF